MRIIALYYIILYRIYYIFLDNPKVQKCSNVVLLVPFYILIY